MGQYTEPSSPVEKAVALLPTLLSQRGIERNHFTTTEIWALTIRTTPTHGELVEMGYALKRAGYEKYGGGNGIVIRIDQSNRGSRYWRILNTHIHSAPSRVRADVKANKL